MDKSPSVPVSMLTTIFPLSTSTSNLAPMARSNVMIGYNGSEIPEENMDEFGSRLGKQNWG